MTHAEPERSEIQSSPIPAWNECKGCGKKGTLEYEDDEYDSLANGGSYEVYRCTSCGKARYFMLPD